MKKKKNCPSISIDEKNVEFLLKLKESDDENFLMDQRKYFKSQLGQIKQKNWNFLPSKGPMDKLHDWIVNFRKEFIFF